MLTDLYQLTMAYGYWKTGIHNHQASFSAIFRNLPFQGGYAICAGLATLIEQLHDFHFTQEDVDYLATLKGNNDSPLFETAFLKYLTELHFSCDVDAIEEGTIVFPQEPLLRITGPLLQAQLLETLVLNTINYQILVATKAARVCSAAKGDTVIEFGLRRAQGPNGGLTASRAAFLGGCAATSNVLAGKLFGIPLGGTHAHSWVMAFNNELDAFKAYAAAMPNNCTLLVDTYKTTVGIKNAITVGKQLKEQGFKLAAIRLDSGDLADLSKMARQQLDKAGFKDTDILASNDLDEYIIESLKEQGAKINIWGVGTRLVTAYDQPALQGVYKLTAVRAPGKNWQHKLKISEQTAKISIPGLLSVKRFFDDKNNARMDVIYDELLGIADQCMVIDTADVTKTWAVSASDTSIELLKAIFRAGKLVYQPPSLQESRLTTINNLRAFPESVRRFLNPQVYSVGLEENLFKLKTKLMVEARK